MNPENSLPGTPAPDGATLDIAAPPPSARALRRVATIGGLILLALITIGTIPRLVARHAAQKVEAAFAAELPRVIVEKPVRNNLQGGLSLPGSMQAVQETIVYARTNGYIRSYSVDLGDRIQAGQALALIDTPEVDQELNQAIASKRQAEAGIAQAKTQLELARVEDGRYGALANTGVVSQQEGDSHKAALSVRQANLEAATAAEGMAAANVHRLEELEHFKTVTAPFDGVITSRSVETGQLVSAGTGAGQALFRVAKTDWVRVFVAVPQIYAPSVKVGSEAKVSLREFPSRPFIGHVTRTANALDPATRTLLTEVRIQNEDGALVPGMYAQVALAADRTDGALLVPGTALVLNAEGSRVAVVENGAVHWRQVVVDADLGDRIAIASGLTETSEVILTPGDRLTEGLKVRSEAAKH